MITADRALVASGPCNAAHDVPSGKRPCPRCGVIRSWQPGRRPLCRDCRSVLKDLSPAELALWEPAPVTPVKELTA